MNTNKLQKITRRAVAGLCFAVSLSAVAAAQPEHDVLAAVDNGAMTASLAVQAVASPSPAAGELATPSAANSTASSKSPVTGLEPGTLALIGFGLLALGAARRKARWSKS